MRPIDADKIVLDIAIVLMNCDRNKVEDRVKIHICEAILEILKTAPTLKKEDIE